MSALPLCTKPDSICYPWRTNAPLGIRHSRQSVHEALQKLHRLLAHVPSKLHYTRRNPECRMFCRIISDHEPHALGLSSSHRRPPSCRGSLPSMYILYIHIYLDSYARLCRGLRDHSVHLQHLELWQHQHHVAAVLALLTGQVPVAKLRRRLTPAGGDGQVQGVCQLVMAHPGHVGHHLANHGATFFGSNCCTAFARRRGACQCEHVA